MAAVLSIIASLLPFLTKVIGAKWTDLITTITNAIGMIIGAVLISRGVDTNTAATIGAGAVGHGPHRRLLAPRARVAGGGGR